MIVINTDMNNVCTWVTCSDLQDKRSLYIQSRGRGDVTVRLPGQCRARGHEGGWEGLCMENSCQARSDHQPVSIQLCDEQRGWCYNSSQKLITCLRWIREHLLQCGHHPGDRHYNRSTHPGVQQRHTASDARLSIYTEHRWCGIHAAIFDFWLPS